MALAERLVAQVAQDRQASGDDPLIDGVGIADLEIDQQARRAPAPFFRDRLVVALDDAKVDAPVLARAQMDIPVARKQRLEAKMLDIKVRSAATSSVISTG